MEEAEDTRVAAKTWREYLAQAGEARRVLRWLSTELKTPESSRVVRLLILAMAIMTLVQTLQPRMVGYIVSGLEHHDSRILLFGFLGFCGLIVAQKLLDRSQARSRERFIGLNWGALDRRMTELFFEKSMGQHIGESARLSVSNIDKGRWKVLDLQNLLFFEGIPALLMLGLAYVLLWILLPFAGAVVTVVLVIYVVWMLYLNIKVIEICTPIDADSRKLNRYRLGLFEMIERVKTNAKEQAEIDRMTQWFDGVFRRDCNFWLWFVDQSIRRQFVGAMGLLAIYAYGIQLVWAGEWPLALLFPLFSWSDKVVENIWRIGQVEHLIFWNLPSVKSMIEALSIPPDVVSKPDGVDLSTAETYEIEFRNVGHTYPIGSDEQMENADGASLPVLQGISFVIKPGKKVGIIGPSGSGKTTLLRLLLRFMDPDFGSIHINGVDLRDARLDSWMRVVGYIPQQAQILDGTIRDNLTYGLMPPAATAVSDEVAWAFMRMLKVDFGKRLTNGLATLVGKRGLRLSGGQAQRVMIAAAAMKEPRVMVIDEATSNLDSFIERGVQEGLKQVLTDRVTALIVAHRLSTLEDMCDMFIVVRSAEEAGGGPQIEAVASSFAELYPISPTFRRLADYQGVVIAPKKQKSRMQLPA
ncbi:MAG: ABC transporter ATP-binding protein [bacterium]|nr:ABC transporter ATP-binding protein [bacterium]